MSMDLSETSIYNFPHAFINKRGEPILIKTLDEKREPKLIDMYLAFRPRGSFSGLPPVADEACVRWARGLIADGINLVALSFEEGVVGHAALLPVDVEECEFMTVVRPPNQRIGIGSELVCCSSQLADELGFERIMLHVESRNHVARHVYEKSGFQYRTYGLRDELDMTLDLRSYRSATHVAVREVMNPRVVAVRPETPCAEALELFLKDRVATLPVVNEQKELLGILSKTDLLIEANVQKKVSEVLTREVVTLNEASTIAKAIAMFRSRKLRCIPILNGRMRLVGVLGRTDILAHYARRL